MRGRRSLPARLAIILALAIFVVAAAGPIVWLLLSSIMEQQALISAPPDFSLPSSVTLAALHIASAASMAPTPTATPSPKPPARP